MTPSLAICEAEVYDDPAFRRRFREASERRETELAAAFRRSGVDAVALATDEDLLAAIVRMAARRKRSKR